MTRDRWITLVVVCAGTAMLLLDVTVVNVALPAIQADLDASFGELQWVIDAYALSLAAVLLTAGALADRVGRRAVYAGGLTAFTMFSALCGVAPPVWCWTSRGARRGSEPRRCSPPRWRCSRTSSRAVSEGLRSASGARSQALRWRSGRWSVASWSTR